MLHIGLPSGYSNLTIELGSAASRRHRGVGVSVMMSSSSVIILPFFSRNFSLILIKLGNVVNLIFFFKDQNKKTIFRDHQNCKKNGNKTL